MKPEIKITMNYSTFVQYQSHSYNYSSNFKRSNKEPLSRYDRETFLKEAIKLLTNELINHKVETKLLEKN